MRKFLVVAVALALILVSCANLAKDDPPTINGTWRLTTFQGTPVSYVGVTGTLVIANEATYTATFSAATGSFSGTVTKKSGMTYALTSTTTNAVDGDFTVSSSGKSLSGTFGALGDVTYSK